MIVTVFPLTVPHRGATHVGMKHIGVEGVVRFVGVYGTVDDEMFIPDPDLVMYDHTLTPAQSAVFRGALTPCFQSWSDVHGHELDPNYIPPAPEPVEPEEEYDAED
jgi:hypothetical protein